MPEPVGHNDLGPSEFGNFAPYKGGESYVQMNLGGEGLGGLPQNK